MNSLGRTSGYNPYLNHHETPATNSGTTDETNTTAAEHIKTSDVTSEEGSITLNASTGVETGHITARGDIVINVIDPTTPPHILAFLKNRKK